MTFLSQATAITALGFRVVPHGTVEPHRHPLVLDWPNVASRDARQLRIWSAAFAFHKPGVGIVIGDDETWVLDVDEPGTYLMRRIVPNTTVVRSGGGGLHLYFKHNAYSRKALKPLGNLYVKGKKRDKAVELFVNPHALLAPGTVHCKTGKRYEWTHEMKPRVATQEFVDRVTSLLWAKSVVTESRGSGYWLPEALEACLAAFGVEYEAGRRQGQYRVPCPWNADHSSPDKPDKTVVFLRDGWPCFSCLSSACSAPNKKTIGDFFRFHDPDHSLFSIESWLIAETARVLKEFRHGKR